MSSEDQFESENTESTTGFDSTTTPPPIPAISNEMTPPELTSENIALSNHIRNNTPPTFTQENLDWIKAHTPPPLPQEYKINQVTNRYSNALSDIKDAEPGLNSAKEKEASALKKATKAQLEANEGLYSKPENGVENIIYNISLYLKRLNWGRAKNNSDKIQKELARPLGGDVLVNSSLETTQHAINPTRLETLIDANQQNPIENASPEMQSALKKQDELAKQLKQI